ncbi:MAG TPA: hypothetical protein VKT82_12050, partial [Ktedonobacterales bacterium]|nr:hypothetical protein [Ktedonobacterales bacterium]
LFSDFGTKVVEFLLKFAAYEESRFDRSIGTLKGPHPSFDADSLFQFDTSIGLSAGSNDGTVITLNPNADFAVQAGVITHEAMEVYFRQADGVNAGTLQMDYIADWMKGQVQTDVADALGGPNPADGMPEAFGETYGQWKTDPYGGKKYSEGFLGFGGPSEGEDPGTNNGPFGWFGPKSDNNFLGNPMGLSLSMLTWETGPNGSCGSGLKGTGC